MNDPTRLRVRIDPEMKKRTHSGIVKEYCDKLKEMASLLDERDYQVKESRKWYDALEFTVKKAAGIYRLAYIKDNNGLTPEGTQLSGKRLQVINENVQYGVNQVMEALVMNGTDGEETDTFENSLLVCQYNDLNAAYEAPLREAEDIVEQLYYLYTKIGGLRDYLNNTNESAEYHEPDDYGITEAQYFMSKAFQFWGETENGKTYLKEFFFDGLLSDPLLKSVWEIHSTCPYTDKADELWNAFVSQFHDFYQGAIKNAQISNVNPLEESTCTKIIDIFDEKLPALGGNGGLRTAIIDTVEKNESNIEKYAASIDKAIDARLKIKEGKYELTSFGEKFKGVLGYVGILHNMFSLGVSIYKIDPGKKPEMNVASLFTLIDNLKTAGELIKDIASPLIEGRRKALEQGLQKVAMADDLIARYKTLESVFKGCNVAFAYLDLSVKIYNLWDSYQNNEIAGFYTKLGITIGGIIGAAGATVAYFSAGGPVGLVLGLVAALVGFTISFITWWTQDPPLVDWLEETPWGTWGFPDRMYGMKNNIYNVRGYEIYLPILTFMEQKVYENYFKSAGVILDWKKDEKGRYFLTFDRRTVPAENLTLRLNEKGSSDVQSKSLVLKTNDMGQIDGKYTSSEGENYVLPESFFINPGMGDYRLSDSGPVRIYYLYEIFTVKRDGTTEFEFELSWADRKIKKTGVKFRKPGKAEVFWQNNFMRNLESHFANDNKIYYAFDEESDKTKVELQVFVRNAPNSYVWAKIYWDGLWDTLVGEGTSAIVSSMDKTVVNIPVRWNDDFPLLEDEDRRIYFYIDLKVIDAESRDVLDELLYINKEYNALNQRNTSMHFLTSKKYLHYINDIYDRS